MLFEGKKLDIKLNPSRGKIGIMLKIIKKAFISISHLKNNIRVDMNKLIPPTTLLNNTKKKLPTTIKMALALTPAIDTLAIPPLYFLKFIGLIGTGFAQPIPATIKQRKPQKIKGSQVLCH